MDAFLGFVRKEILHVVRDRRTLLILFGLPVIQLVLFGFVVRNEVDGIRVAVVDASGDAVTQALTARLLASPHFEGVAHQTDARGLEALFQRGAIQEAVVFAPRFAERLAREGTADVQVITDATDPNTARTILAYTTAILRDYERERGGARTAAAARIVPVVRMRFNPTLESVNLFVPGLVAVILMLVSALMTSITITREKELGTMEVLLASPLRPPQIIAGKVLPYLALSFVNVATILVLARLVFGVPVRGSVALLLAESLLFIVCALALGILISTRSRTQQTATMASLAGLLLPTIILSGFIFPIASMPAPLQWLSHLVPAKWFLVVIRGIMIRGVGLDVLWPETLVLAAMTAVLLAASLRTFKIRLE